MREDLLSFLSDPKTYGLSQEVLHIETHISDVFLAGDFVYKVKKPVFFGFLDFSTLEKRKFYCEEEVRLNQRLAQDVYLGVVPICRHRDGRLFFGDGEGEIIEYAVKMRRLDEEESLPRLIESGRFSEGDMDRLVDKLCEFYRGQGLDKENARFGRPEMVKHNACENFEQIFPCIGDTILPHEFSAVESFSNTFLLEQRELFLRRAEEGNIKDCHGDLHAGHIYFSGGKPLVLDAIEFNERFRYGDAASDIAFLTMDLAFLGYPRLALLFAHKMAEALGDKDLPKLLPFYEVYRACVRGKVEGFSYLDAKDHEQRRFFLNRVRRYFRLAWRMSLGLPRPFAVVIHGLMGSGKTTLAHFAQEALDIEAISTDKLRKTIAGTGLEPSRVPFGSGIYDAEMTKNTYIALADEGVKRLAQGKSVIFDGSFAKPWMRRLLEERLFALEERPKWLFVYLDAPLALLEERLNAREIAGEKISDGRLELLQAQIAGFSPPGDGVVAPVLRVDASLPLERQLGLVFKALASCSGMA